MVTETVNQARDSTTRAIYFRESATAEKRAASAACNHNPVCYIGLYVGAL